jgi:TPR repeat protein
VNRPSPYDRQPVTDFTIGREKSHLCVYNPGAMTNESQPSDLKNGIAALRAGEIAAAKEILRPVAERGGATAQYYMGHACEARFETDTPAEAIAWYRRAIAGGSGEALHALGILYRYDDTVAPAEKAEADDLLRRAARHFEAAAEAGDARAQCRFGEMLVRGHGVEPDRKRGLDWWRKGGPTAGTGWQVALGSNLLWDEESGQGEPAEAIEWFERAAKAGHRGAAYFLGATYATGDEITKDYDKAVHWYQEAALLGDAEAKYNLGIMYCSGEGVVMDRERGRKLLLEAGEEGDMLAQYLLADAYRDAFWGFPKDNELAAYWCAEYERTIGDMHP